jgi:hypothetical protein
LRCLKKNPAGRFQNVEEMLERLFSIDLKLPAGKTRGRQISGLISKEITVSFRLKKFMLPALIFVAIVIAGLFIWRPWAQKTTTVIPSGKPSLAIVSFRNSTGDSGVDKFKDMFPDYLIEDLRQSTHIHVLEIPQVYGTLQRLNLLEAEILSEADLKNKG